MRNYRKFRAAVVALIGFCLSGWALGQGYRSEPACYEEQLTLENTMAKILAYQIETTSSAPGREIMSESYWGPDWRKNETHEIHRSSEAWGPLGQVYSRRKRVEIHFMLNVATREVKQVKFKSSIQEGCEGELEWPWTSRGAAGSPEPKMDDEAPTRKGEVTVGPVLPGEHPPAQGAPNCASCHGGSGSSSLSPRRLKTPPHRFQATKLSGSKPPVVDDVDFSPLDEDHHRHIADAEPRQRGRRFDSLLA